MKITLVDTGVGSSTLDVFNGYLGALLRAGHDVYRYNLTARIGQADAGLQAAWIQAGKPADRPVTRGDVFYRASEGVLTCVLRHETPLVLIVTDQWFHPDYLVMLQRIGVTVGLIFTESPYGDTWQAKYAQCADIAWTQERASVDRLRRDSENPFIYYLPAAFDATLHSPLPIDVQPDLDQHDVVLVGTAFKERVDFLKAVKWRDVNLGLYGDWGMIRKRSRLGRAVNSFILPNKRAARLYQRASIGLNLYRDGLVLNCRPDGYISYDGSETVVAESMNPRAYELAACGCFQLSQYRAEVADVFGTAVPTFQTPAELTDMIHFYLADPDARNDAIDRAARAVVGHSFDDRLKQIERDLRTMRSLRDVSTSPNRDLSNVAAVPTPLHLVTTGTGTGG